MIFVVDDDEIFREEVGAMVEFLGYRVTQCANAFELQATAMDFRSGCILLDIKLPGLDGIAAQEWADETGVDLPIVFVSGIADASTAVHCMKSGAFDFLIKPVHEISLRKTINAAVGFSRKQHCWRENQREIEGLINALTPTELSVAKLIADGLPAKHIASIMDRSENTIKIHRHKIFQKLMVGSAASVANILRHVSD